MTLQNIRIWMIRLLLGYLLIGSIYYLSGYLFNLAMGKEIVFTHMVGFPLTVMGWPGMVYGDLVNAQTLGIKLPTILTLVSMAAMLTSVIIKVIKNQ